MIIAAASAAVSLVRKVETTESGNGFDMGVSHGSIIAEPSACKVSPFSASAGPLRVRVGGSAGGRGVARICWAALRLKAQLVGLDAHETRKMPISGRGNKCGSAFSLGCRQARPSLLPLFA
jgi:hypothetical protein